jgi:hypothetical protein
MICERDSGERAASRARVAPVTCALIGAALLAVAAGASATIVGGGGSARTDCLAVLDAPVNAPASKPRNVRCVDGDPACDADGVVNGGCRFPVAVCANSTFDPECTLSEVQSITVEHAADNGDPDFDPEFQALQARITNEIAPPTDDVDECTDATNIIVPIIGPFGDRCRKRSKQLKLTSVSQVIAGQIYTDKDRLKLTCDPAPSGCDAQTLFTGTFDRIQRQIFDQSCAVSGCHDSQTMQAGMLLEAGAAHTNLVGVTPTNGAAAAAGWKRVNLLGPGSGDPETSLLFHKLIGPPPGFGSRMPLDRGRLNSTLIDVIELWIAAGAPETGWVPGTD